MTFTIYRSECQTSYPHKTHGFRHAFGPIAYGATTRVDLLTGSTYPSVDAPYATIEAPEGSRFAEAKCGDTALYVPGETTGLEANEVLVLARMGHFGLRLL